VANSGELLYTQCFFKHCISILLWPLDMFWRVYGLNIKYISKCWQLKIVIYQIWKRIGTGCECRGGRLW
jgi:hypothetical protein